MGTAGFVPFLHFVCLFFLTSNLLLQTSGPASCLLTGELACQFRFGQSLRVFFFTRDSLLVYENERTLAISCHGSFLAVS